MDFDDDSRAMKPGLISGSPSPLTRISYWLLVAAEEGDRFTEMIGRLSGSFGGPVFRPHLTVYSGPAGSDDPEKILDETAESGGVIQLRCTGLEFSDKFTKACFLTFHSNQELTRLSEKIRKKCGKPASYRLDPHLSLFYGKLAGPHRERIREMVRLPKMVRFDDLAAMATSAVIRNGRDVLSWRCLAKCRI